MTSVLSATMFSHNSDHNEDQPTYDAILQNTNYCPSGSSLWCPPLFSSMERPDLVQHYQLPQGHSALGQQLFLGCRYLQTLKRSRRCVLNVPEYKLISTIAACCPPSIPRIAPRKKSMTMRKRKTEADWGSRGGRPVIAFDALAQ
ncbi:unnamed protein product [Mortierella alpina]